MRAALAPAHPRLTPSTRAIVRVDIFTLARVHERVHGRADARPRALECG